MAENNEIDIKIETPLGELEIYDDLPVQMDISIKDIKESPLNFLYEHSKTITLPATDNNAEIFGFINIDNLRELSMNPHLYIDASILLNGSIYRSGSLKLTNIIKDGENRITDLEVEFISSLIEIKEKIENLRLTDLDLSKYDHEKNKTNIKNSWDTSIKRYGSDIDFKLGRGYVYPLIDYGGRISSNTWQPKDFKPAVYVKELFDKIMNDLVGFDYSSDFIESDYFRSLIIPGVNQEEISDKELRNRRSRAILGNRSSFPSHIPSGAVASPQFESDDFYSEELATRNDMRKFTDVIFKDDNNNGSKNVNPKKYDQADNYDVTTGKYTVPEDGKYNIESRLNVIPIFYNNDSDFDFNDIVQRKTDPNDSQTAINDNYSFIRTKIVKNDVNGVESVLDTNEKVIKPNLPAKGQSSSSDNVDHLKNNGWIGARKYGDVEDTSNKAPVHHLGNSQDGGSDIFLKAGEEIFIRLEIYFGGSPIYEFGSVAFDGAIDTLYGETDIVPPFKFFAQVKAGNSEDHLKVEPKRMEGVEQGTEFRLSSVLPDMSCYEFLSSIIKMFNLYTLRDTETRTLKIEPFKDIFNIGSTIDWTHKIDLGDERNYEILPEISSKYIFKYSEPKDKLVEEYNEKNDHNYGTKVFNVTGSDRADGEDEMQIDFAPTRSENKFGMRLPRILGSEDDDEPTGYKRSDDRSPRILFYYGKTYAQEPWTFQKPSSEELDKYPYAGHMNKANNPSEDLNFGLVTEYPWDNITNNTLFDKYHEEFIKNIVDNRSYLLTAKIKLDVSDLMNLSLNDTIFIEGNTYIINNMSIDLTDLKNPQEIELIHMPNFDTTVKDPQTIDISQEGVRVPIGPIDADPLEPELSKGLVNSGDVVPIDGIGINNNTMVVRRTSNNERSTSSNGNISGNNVFIIGINNIVSRSSENIFIQGNNNNIKSNSNDIWIKGDNNTVEDGLTNVTLINTNGITVTRSNVVYYGNQIVQLPGNPKAKDLRDIVIGGRNQVDEEFKSNPEEIIIGGRDAIRGLGADFDVYMIIGGRNSNDPKSSDDIQA